MVVDTCTSIWFWLYQMVGAWSWKHDTALPILYCDSLVDNEIKSPTEVYGMSVLSACRHSGTLVC